MTTENNEDLLKIEEEWQFNYSTYSLLFQPSKEKAKEMLTERLTNDPYKTLIQGKF